MGLLEHAADLVFTSDLTGRITSINRAGERLLGYSRDEAPDELYVSEMASAEHRTTLRQMLVDQLGGGRQQDHHCLIESRSGERIPMRVALQLIFREGRPAGMIGFARQVPAAEEANPEPLARAHVRLGELRQLHETNFGSRDDWLRHALGAIRRFLELDAALLFEEKRGALELRTRSPETPTAAAEGLESRLREYCGEGLDLPGARVLRGFVESAGLVVVCPVRAGFRSLGVVGGVRSKANPVTETDKAFLESVAALMGGYLVDEQYTDSRRDRLTGLPNEAGMRSRLGTALRQAQSQGGMVGVLVADVDRFHQFRLRFGHGAADGALCALAKRFEEAVPDRRMLACLGADRFAVILPSIVEADEARDLGRKLLEAAREPLEVPYSDASITVSVGIALDESGRETATGLLRKAVTACLGVKHRGCDGVEVYSGRESALEGVAEPLETDLQHALERRELILLFQPQITVEGEMYGFEALLAWDHPRLGRLNAFRFIHLAEQSGLIVPIGRWVIEEACRYAAYWARRRMKPVRLAVNVSTLQLDRDDFFEVVRQALQDAGADPRRIELEVTESGLMRNVPKSALVIQRLRDLGLRVAIDDFGTGYSSLSYLLRLPVDTLKIDRSFLNDPGASGSLLPVIQAIVALAHELGASVVGEGVETEDQYKLLKTAGCDRLQGHLFSRPLDGEAAGKLIGNGGAHFAVSGE